MPQRADEQAAQTSLLGLHAVNGNAMRAATLESRLEELGVLRSISKPRVSNDNPYSEFLFRKVKYRPDYTRKPFPSKDLACQWVRSFVDWYNHRHRHSGTKFVTPIQCHSGEAVKRFMSLASGLPSTNRLLSAIQGVGHDRPGGGVNRRLCESISRQMNSKNCGRYR